MKIANVETVTLSIPFDHGGPPTGFGGTEWRNLDTLLIKVETDEGHVGWGEAFGFNAIPSTRAALKTMIAPLVIGRDAGDIAALHAELQKVLHIFGRYGQTIYALSGLDIALWDIAGKAAGMPLHRMLGGAQRMSLEAYASLLRYFEPDLVGERCADAAAQGYGWVKLHERMEPAVAAARAAIPAEAKLMVDTNCPWTLAEAQAKAESFEPHDVHWLEEPIWPPENFAGLAELRGRFDMGIAAGENLCTAWQFQAMLEAEAVDVAQPSVTKVGGVTEMRKVEALCNLHNTRYVPHSPYFGPGFLATLHLLAVADTEEPVERFFGIHEAEIFGDLCKVEDGRIAVPDGSGLGRDPSPEVLRDYAVA